MKRTRGFGTLEMMLAVYLLALGLAATAYMIPVSSRGLAKGRLMTQAVFFAQQRLEEALASPTAQTVMVHPEVPELSGEIRRWSYGDNLRRVEAVVYRTGDLARRPLVQLESLGVSNP